MPYIFDSVEGRRAVVVIDLSVKWNKHIVQSDRRERTIQGSRFKCCDVNAWASHVLTEEEDAGGDQYQADDDGVLEVHGSTPFA
jgi:hypothetical protein